MATATKNPENMSKAELMQALKDAKARANGAKPMSLKVSAKGALSIYGLQRFPVTLFDSSGFQCSSPLVWCVLLRPMLPICCLA